MLNVNYLHLLHFSLKVLLWEPLLCWSGRGFYSCGLGSSPLARVCCTQSCPGKSSPSLPAGAGSAGPFAEVALRAFGEGIWSSDRSARGDDRDTHATSWQRPGQQGTQLPPRPLPVSLWGSIWFFICHVYLENYPGSFEANLGISDIASVRCVPLSHRPVHCSAPALFPGSALSKGTFHACIQSSLPSPLLQRLVNLVPAPGPQTLLGWLSSSHAVPGTLQTCTGLVPPPPNPGLLSTPYTLPSGGSHSPPWLQLPLTGWQLKVLVAQSWPTLRLHGL